jgi:outer membrane protein assembly factor BamA
MIKRYSLLIVLLALSRVAMAQDPTPGVELPTDAKTPTGSPHGGFVGIPVVTSTPTLGFGLGAVGVFLFSLDSASSKSVVGIGGAYSDTKSWIFEAGGRVAFHGDARQGAAGANYFELNYNFFGVGFEQGNAGNSVDITQNGDAQMLQMLGRTKGRFYVGPKYLHRGISTSIRKIEPSTSDTVLAVARANPNANTSALGVKGEYDSRNQQNEPTRGTEADLEMMFASHWLGTDESYNWFRGWINEYVPLSSHDAVLALRLNGCRVGANAAVWELCLYGVDSDLRGYAGGRYRDNAMFAGQAELRLPIMDRIGAVVFGGVGAVEPSFSELAMDQLLPAGGLGVRYLVYESWHIKVGVDVAWGRNGSAFYLRLGEAF